MPTITPATRFPHCTSISKLLARRKPAHRDRHGDGADVAAVPTVDIPLRFIETCVRRTRRSYSRQRRCRWNSGRCECRTGWCDEIGRQPEQYCDENTETRLDQTPIQISCLFFHSFLLCQCDVWS